MKFISIEGERFKSFVEPFRFSLCREPGLYLLSGDNKAEPHLGGNGVGKSTIWDALFWAFTGTTLRNLKNTDIKPWTTTGNTWVSVSFTDASNDLLTVRRQTGPRNLLTIESDIHQVEHDITTEELLKMFNLSETQLRHSLIIGQFGEFFFDMQAAKKQGLFSTILSLDVWLTRSKIAGQMATDIKNALRTAELQYGKLQAAIEQLGSFDVKLDSKAWEGEHAAELVSLEYALHDVTAQYRKMNASSTEQELSQVEGLLSDTFETLEQVQKEITSLNKELHGCERERDSVDQTINGLINDLDDTANQGACSYCGHEVTDKQLDRLEHTTKTKVDDLEDNIDILIAAADDITKELQPKLELLKMQTEEKEGLLDKIRTLESDSRQHASELKRLRREQAQLDSAYTRAKRKKNPWTSLQDSNEADRIEMGGKLLTADTGIRNLTEALDQTTYWVKGFKDVRLFMIDQYLVDLEVEVNNSVQQLGLEGWRIEFAVDRETKRGTTKKGFEVYVYSPRNKKPVRWECWSGGESSRLRLAGQLGLLEMIFTATGEEPNFEVYDEPTSYMSQEGIEDLLDLLRERALLKQKQIYIIDHHSFNYGGFTKNITIERDNIGSRIVEEGYTK